MCHREFTSGIATVGGGIARFARNERCTTAAMALRMLALVALAGCFYEASSPLPDDFGSCPAEVSVVAGAAAPT